MCRRRCWTSAHHRGKVTGILEGLAEFEVEIAVWDGSEAETSLGGIIQVGAHGGKIDERHLDRPTQQ